MTTTTTANEVEKVVRLRDSIDNALRAGATQANFNVNALLGDVRQALESIHRKKMSVRIVKSMIRASQKRLGLPTSWDDEWNTTPAIPRGLGRKKIEAKIKRFFGSVYRDANRGRIAAERVNRDLRKRIAELEKKIETIRSASS
jgi:hypothetical protein